MESRVCWFVLTVLLCKDVSVIKASTTVVVDSPFGKIEGVRKTDEVTGESYVSFQGIPYAKPPVGPLRFHKPEPHPALDSVFDATKEEWIACPHPDILSRDNLNKTEDCLVLNIQAQDGAQRATVLKKVMVFIHGGGFFAGCSYNQKEKSFVISQDVIVVTINYRLGILGFLSTEDEASPGNYGLWDQTLALKWVKDNIRAFGGDPDDVTIGGVSAGGASVGYQTLTPHARGLFSKAYQQSGTATSIFARSFGAQFHALGVAKTVGCWNKNTDYRLNIEESTDVIQCLRKVPVSAFTSFNIATSLTTLFAPRVDGDFIPDTPANLLKDDAYLESIRFFDKPHLVGLVNFESGIVKPVVQGMKMKIMSNNQTSVEEKERALNDSVLTVKTFSTQSRLDLPAKPSTAIIDAVSDFYDRRIANTIDAAIDMNVDLNFLVPSLDDLRAVSRHELGTSYFLLFDHFPSYMRGPYRGLSHGMDQIYLFDIPVQQMESFLHIGSVGEMQNDDVELKRMYMSVIGDFVRSGDPGHSLKTRLPNGWPEFDPTTSYYLNFNLNPWVSRFLEKDKQDFWFETIPKLLKEEKVHKHSEL